jgi:hypothetical protein
MLYYDDGLSQLFAYAEVNDNNTQKDCFRLISMDEVVDVIEKLRRFE